MTFRPPDPAAARLLADAAGETPNRDAIRRLRKMGLARNVTVFDPARSGRPLECVMLVRLCDYSLPAIARLERVFKQDPNVLSAAAVTGVFDYQVYCAFPDFRAADAWVRGLRDIHPLAGVELRRVQARWGSSTDGVVLAGTLRSVD